ncbi:MAG: GTPase ObgE [Clostridiales bacterium]|nr:GTPase ObgE [Clostridiales bacterium]
MILENFLDKESILIKSGDGGDGITSFIRYKGVSAGGPDGGDGGNGGNVYFVGDRHKTSLIDFKYKHKFVAENGARGDTKNCHGKNGEDLIIPVPLGTVITDAETGDFICDIYYDGQKRLMMSGGKGGKGNAKFTTSRRHCPHFAQKGEKTEIKRVNLELKVIADVGLIGFPNVGKSTLLSKISGAKPKIANYHFTTLSPNLGVVNFYDDSFVAADIPGLIEGAADGLGLGHDFLRHIERTRLLCHVVDISGVEGRNPLEDYKAINKELKNYSKTLSSLKQIIVLNKCDIFGAEENIKEFKSKVKGKKILTVSALTGEGKEELIKVLAEELKTIPVYEPIEDSGFSYDKEKGDSFEIYRDEDGAFIVDGELVAMLSRNVVIDDMDSMAYMQKILRNKGVIKKLRELGCKDGDTVVIGDIEFDYVE